MKFLVIGLGSMGKRRVRNLYALNHKDVAGFDLREDRRQEAEEKYSIKTYETFEEGLSGFSPDALIISTGPKYHMDYALPAADMNIPCFIEASVSDVERISLLRDKVRGSGLVMAPSCTYRYFPGPKIIRDLIEQKAIGEPININYQTGQYLPDWHPWEHIRDFYVSDRETGACREIVPFEMAWINEIFGTPKAISSVRRKITDMDADIDDIYHCHLQYPDGPLASLTVEVVSRPRATREMRILGTKGEIVFSGDENCVRHISIDDEDWVLHEFPSGTVESGYINPEEPYISEMADFVNAVESSNPDIFPNTLDKDISVLGVLNEIESLGR